MQKNVVDSSGWLVYCADASNADFANIPNVQFLAKTP